MIHIENKKYASKDIFKSRPLFFAIGLSISLSIATVMINWNFHEKQETVDLGKVKDDFEEVKEIPQTRQKKPPKPKKVQPKIVEVPDDEKIDDDVEVDLDIAADEQTEVSDSLAFGDDSGGPKEEEADKIFQMVQEKAKPKGGMSAFYKYVRNNLEYPKRALENNVSGKVYVQFVVEKNGELNNIKVLKGIGYGCDEEAKRILREAPKWEPGQQRGRPVRVRRVLPITFKMRT